MPFVVLVCVILTFINKVYLSKMSLMADGSDESEEVNNFLQNIKELSNRRDSEDQEGTKKLEEEILQGRRERQARRAGRAIPGLLQATSSAKLQYSSSIFI